MATYRDVDHSHYLMGRLGHGLDLLEELTAVAAGQNLTLGRLEVLGAVQRARLGYYDQGTHEYKAIELHQPMEITCCLGNVSLRAGKPIVHAHLTLADERGRAYGGHLMTGTILFAAEFVLQALKGPELVRGHDETTGLPLWEM